MRIAFYLTAAAFFATFTGSKVAREACQSEAQGDVGLYPDSSLSPSESLAHHDTVFLAEVAVPLKPCSLGFCAGFKVVQTIKGSPGTSALVQVQPTTPATCPPARFQIKGNRWLIFANQGTSRSGFTYFQVEEHGPSFRAKEIPDFNLLQRRYLSLRAELDRAIEERLEHLR